MRTLRELTLKYIALTVLLASAATAVAQTDTTPPRIESITRFDPVDEYTTATTMTWEVTFSEDVTGVSLSGDFVIAATFGLVSGVPSASQMEISASVYRFTVSLTFTGDAGSVRLIPSASAAFEDTSGNAMVDFAIVNSNEAYQYDARAPTLTISTTEIFPTNETVIPLTFTFSEPVTGFDASDLALTTGTGTFSGFSGSGAVYTANLNLSSEGAFQVSVADATTIDRAGNQNTGAVLGGSTDFTVPTAALSAIPATVNGPFDVTVTFNENVAGFALGDFAITNGTASNLQMTSAQVYTATVTPTADGAVSVSVPAGAAADVSGNGNTASNTVTTTADVTRPTLIFSALPALVNAPFTLTMTFSEPVSDFTVSDLNIGNGTASNFLSSSATVYTATITPTADGAVTIGLPENVVVDGFALGNVAAATSTTADITAPTASLSAISATVNGPFDVTVTFNENVAGFALGDFAITNGTASNLQMTSAQVYTVTVTPTADGAVSMSVPAGAAADTAGNVNTASNTVTTTADVTRPTLVFSTLPEFVNEPFTLTMTFSEDVSGFAMTDLVIGNGSASNFQSSSATVYTATITPASDGEVTIDLPENVVVDGFDLGNEAVTTASTTADLTDPTPTLTATPDFPGTPYSVTISFDEVVTGLELNDFATSNVNLASLSGGDMTYTLQATATDFDQSIQLNAGTVLDVAGNANPASNVITVPPDSDAPTVVISPIPLSVGGPFEVTITFDEDVTGFSLSGLSVTHGTVSNLQAVSAQVYTVTVNPRKGDTVSLYVLAGAAADLAGNLNTASNSVSASGPSHLPASSTLSQLVLFILLTLFGARTLRRRR